MTLFFIDKKNIRILTSFKWLSIAIMSKCPILKTLDANVKTQYV